LTPVPPRPTSSFEPDPDVNAVVKGYIRDVWPSLLRAANLPVVPEYCRFEDPTMVQLPEHRLDQILVFEPPNVSEKVAFCLEYALEPPDRRTLVRWLWKALGAELQLGCTTILLALYLWRGARSSFPNRLVTRFLGLISRTRFPTACVWDWKDRIQSGELRELAPLLVFCEDRPTQETLLRTRELLLHASIAPERRPRLIWSAILFAVRHFPVELILEVYREERSMIREWPIVKEWEAEAEARGRAEGDVRARQRMLEVIARPRLGEPDPNTLAKLERITNPAELESLALRVPKVESWSELLAE
jgi:hypothetical protein